MSLVDPDNRRPVDFSARQRILSESLGKGVGFAENWEEWNRQAGLDATPARASAATRGGLCFGKLWPPERRWPAFGPRDRFSRRFRERACCIVTLRYFAPFTRDGANWPDFSALDARLIDGPMELDVGQLLGDCPAAVFSYDEWLNKTGRADRVLSLA